jgi:hypothetical protein
MLADRCAVVGAPGQIFDAGCRHCSEDDLGLHVARLRVAVVTKVDELLAPLVPSPDPAVARAGSPPA